MKITAACVCGLAILATIILFMVGSCKLSCSASQKSGFERKDPTTFDNADYQTYWPSITHQYRYYKGIGKPDKKGGCDGQTDDYDCLQRQRLKTYQRGMGALDAQTMVCQGWPEAMTDKDTFYRCLASVYSDYKYP